MCSCSLRTVRRLNLFFKDNNNINNNNISDNQDRGKCAKLQTMPIKGQGLYWIVTMPIFRILFLKNSKYTPFKIAGMFLSTVN